MGARIKSFVRLGAVALSLLCTLLLIEFGLWLADLPTSPAPRSKTLQFAFPPAQGDSVPFYVNRPNEAIRFVYDSNPRGYFGPQNEVDHHTNEFGFRGKSFSREKPPGTLRLAFLGDSFTFGEGVRDQDTYAEITAQLLQKAMSAPITRVESYNYGVGGYNTSQALTVLQRIALRHKPDMIILGYVLNDADPPIFHFAPGTRKLQSWDRHAELEGLAPDPPPANFLFRTRLGQLAWQVTESRKKNERLISYYRARYDDQSPGWQESQRALQRIAEIAREQGIPCLVLIFPLLYELNSSYPYAVIHAKVRRAAEEAGAVAIDLFPWLKGKRADRLWVHPADQHPNEIVHHIAAEELFRVIMARRLLPSPPAP